MDFTDKPNLQAVTRLVPAKLACESHFAFRIETFRAQNLPEALEGEMELRHRSIVTKFAEKV